MIRRLAGLVAITAACGAAVPALAASAPVRDARVSGSFTMHGVITRAENVAGERTGQAIVRTWTITSADCEASICRSIRVDRVRAQGAHTVAVLRSRGGGLFSGTGSFYVPLRCNGRTYPHGARAPYTLTVQVLARQRIAGILYATSLHATYVGGRRIDHTKCPLGVSEDAARYHSTAATPAPAS